ncbi:MAG: MFS transporter [Dehalococcoidia bacterium]
MFYGWWIVAAGFLNQALAAALLQRSYGAYVVLLREEFGWSKAELSAAYSMQQVENGILGPIQGWLVDRFGPRASMRVGMVMFGLGFIWFSRIDSLSTFYIAFVMMALGSSLGGFFPFSVATVNWFSRRRSRALSTMQMGGALGGLLIFIVVFALETFGWRQTAFVSGLLILGVGLPLTQIIRRRPEDHGMVVDGVPPEDQPAIEDGALRGARLSDASGSGDFTLKQAMATPAFWLISLGHASALLIVSAVNVHIVLYITEDLGYSLGFASLVLMVLTVAQVAGIGAGAVVGDRWDKRHIAVGCMAFHTMALLLVAYAFHPAVVFAFAVMHGAAWGLRGPMMQAIRAEYFGRSAFGSILGVSSLLVMAGTISGPLVAGVLADRTGSYRLGFTILAILSGSGAVFFMLARRPTLPPGGGPAEESTTTADAGRAPAGR